MVRRTGPAGKTATQEDGVSLKELDMVEPSPAESSEEMTEINRIAVYSYHPWENVLPILRILSPAKMAGIEVIRGNEWDQVSYEGITQADAVVIQRDFPKLEDPYRKIISIARAAGKPVIFELDDLLLELPEEHPDRPIHYYTRSVVPMLRAVVEADLVIVCTTALAAHIRQLNPNVHVLPNYLNDEVWTLRAPQKAQSNNEIILGYMGSSSHMPDLQMLAPYFNQIATRFRQKVRFRFWGIRPPDLQLPDSAIDYFPETFMRYVDFVEYFLQQECDIFIAPLVDNPFNRCKSGLKFLEYSALGVPGVYSRLDPYMGMVEDGRTGVLAYDLEEWYQKTASLIESPELRFEVANHAQKAIRRKWLLSKNARKWKGVYQSAKARKEISPNQRFLLELIDRVRYWQEASDELKLQALRDIIAQKEGVIKQHENYLDDLHSSKAWQLITALWAARSKLLPNDSAAYRWLSNISRTPKSTPKP